METEASKDQNESEAFAKDLAIAAEELSDFRSKLIDSLLSFNKKMHPGIKMNAFDRLGVTPTGYAQRMQETLASQMFNEFMATELAAHYSGSDTTIIYQGLVFSSMYDKMYLAAKVKVANLGMYVLSAALFACSVVLFIR